MNKKNAIKKFGLVCGILVTTVSFLAGCGKKKEETKTYDKENNEIVVENSEKANEAIIKALKDETWQSSNILPEYFSKSDEYSKELQAGSKIYYARMSDVDEMPVYVVNVIDCSAGAQYINAITYKDGKVVVSKKPATGEYSYTLVDVNKNIVAITNEPTGNTSVYKIENNEFVKVASCEIDLNTYKMSYRVGDEIVSQDRFKEYIKGCVNMTLELNNSKISASTNQQEATNSAKTENNVGTATTASKKYIGEIQTVDSNTQSPSFATTTYTVSVSDNAIEKIVAEVQYKAKDTVTITINNINVTSQDVAAGTSYVEFSFEGQTADGSKYTGTGTYSYSNVVDDSEIGLEMNYNEDIFNGVNISTGYRIRLGLGKALTNQPK